MPRHQPKRGAGRRAGFAALALSVAFSLFAAVTEGRAAAGRGGQMEITSPEFKMNGMIPDKFTCRGTDVNPRLAIENVPASAKSLALIVDDPDAPMGTWVHWVVFNMPVVREIRENSVPGVPGMNDFGVTAYRGPCPPMGTHRYFFKLYALDTMLGSKEGIRKNELEKSMEGHVLAKAELIGLFKK